MVTMSETPDEPQVIHDDATGRDFVVGGTEGGLDEEGQLEQLAWYLNQHHPAPDLTPPWAGGTGDRDTCDDWAARLPDRLTHAAMLMLGTAAGHRMPGVDYLGGVTADDLPGLGVVFTPSEPTGDWAVSLHGGGWWRGAGTCLDNAWRPGVAAVAELSGTTIIDVDYPLAPEHPVTAMRAVTRAAIAHARQQGARHVAAWGESSGAALAALVAGDVDKLLLTRPSLHLGGLPDAVRGDAEIPDPATWPRTMIQVGEQDTTVPRFRWAEHVAEVLTYTAQHSIATPTVARKMAKDAADFLRG